MQPAISVFALAAVMTGTPTRPIPYKAYGPNDFQAFVANWSPAERPFCAALQTPEQWSAAVHPAPTMFSRRRYGPPDGFWRDRAMLLIARVAPMGGDVARVLRIERVEAAPGRIRVIVRFTPPPASSAQIKAWAAAAVAKPLPPLIEFRDASGVLCTVQVPRDTPPPGRP